MNVSIVKGVRTLKMTKTERGKLDAALMLCGELATVAEAKAKPFFAAAAEQLKKGLDALDGKDVETKAPAGR